jgi:uncharacterized protein (TIGR00106 family)
MKAVAEVQVIPIGSGVSVRREVQRAHRVLEQAGLNPTLHAYGTNVEGDLEEILRAVTQIHEILHAEGTIRLSTFLKIGTRTDKEPTLSGKLF